jgi:fructuronate reductase
VALTPGLRRSGLGSLPAAARPLVAPAPAGIVHIGLGAFHRAHQAVFTEAAMAAAGGDWGIVAVAPRSPTLVDVLRQQDHLFSVTSRSADGDTTRVIGSLAGVAHLPSEPDDILTLLASPEIRVVTLTVTEKAYRLDPDDLSPGCPPRTVAGLLIRGLQRRAAAGGPPLAVVSCDNLPGNGARVRALVEQALDGSPGDWVSFPSTMVDRIVPATTAATLARAQAALGAVDLAAVEAEPFTQWVIEDDFAGGRPAWHTAGAVLTDDVTSWERLKLRVLNGLHSTTAYLGALAGRETIAATMALPGLPELLRQLAVADIGPTLTPPPGVRVEEYADQTLERFANPAIEHRTIQVAMDGSQKLPQRLLHTIADRRAQGAPPGLAALTVAAWMRFVGGVADDGQPLPLDDPLAGAIRAARPASDDPRRIVRGLLGLTAIFPPALREDEELVDAVVHWLEALATDGAAATIRTATRQTGATQRTGVTKRSGAARLTEAAR